MTSSTMTTGRSFKLSGSTAASSPEDRWMPSFAPKISISARTKASTELGVNDVVHDDHGTILQTQRLHRGVVARRPVDAFVRAENLDFGANEGIHRARCK